MQQPVVDNDTEVLRRPFGCYGCIVGEPAIEVVVAGFGDELLAGVVQ